MSKQTVRSKIKSFTKTVFDLNAGRLKKILFATGFLVLGMCTAVESAYATPTITGIDKGEYEGKVRVEVKITETDPEYDISGLSYKTGSVGNPIVLGNNNIINWKDVKWKNNKGKKEAIVALEVPNGAVKLVATSQKGENASTMVSSEEFVINNITPCEGPKVKDGTLIKYHSEEYGDYIQAQFTGTSRIWKITDVDGKNVVELNEKEQDTTVTLKYILTPDQESFEVYDIVGHETTVSIANAVDVTFNARTKDGSRFVLGVSETIEQNDVTYTLDSIQTGAGQDIDYHSGNAMYGKADANDNEDADLNEIVGVTRLKLTYKADSIDTPIVVNLPLILDKTSPEVVGYVAKSEGDGTYTVEKIEANIRKNITDNSGVKLRAYVNNKTDKCIVEVRDVQSGIDTIELLKGAKGAYKLINNDIAKKAGYNSQGKLEASVLHLFSFAGLKDRVTAVRVTDGLGNAFDVPVEVSTVDDEDTIVFAKLEEYTDEYGHTAYKVVAQDYKAGLWKIERDTDVDDIKQVLVNFESSVAEGIIVEEMENGVITSVPHDEINKWLEIAGEDYDDEIYKQYTLERVVRNITQQGQPTIMVYDALGNARKVSFDDIAFACYYATYNGKGSLAMNLKETRGIWKITVDIVSPEVAEEEPKYIFTVNEEELEEVPVYSNEPLYEGDVPSNGSESKAEEEFFITCYTQPDSRDDSNPIPPDYVAANDNRPKYITSEGKEVVPNNGLGNVDTYGEYFSTDPGSAPEGYKEIEDNRPKYNGKVPQEEVNEPKYTYMPEGGDESISKIPSSANEPKYNGLVPSSTNEPKYKGAIASNDNEPKYKGDVPTSIDNNEFYNNLEASEKAEYEAVLAEHNKWEAARTAHAKWEAAKTAHAEWEEALEEHNKWSDTLADYNEWKLVLEEYKVWKEVNEEHIKWQQAKEEHEEWEKNIVTYILEVFRENNEPEKLIKTYEIPDGVVQNIKVYHTNGRMDLMNEVTSVASNRSAALQNVTELAANEVIYADATDVHLSGSEIVGTTVRASRGVKLVEYADKTVVEFHKDLPTELYVSCENVSVTQNDSNTPLAQVTDSLGCKLKIYSTEVEYYRFGEDGSVVPDERVITVGEVQAANS